MSGDRPIGEDDLQAFVDDRLAPERHQAVEEFLAGNPAAAERVAAYREQRDQLRARLAFKASEPTPARLRVAAVRAERARRMRARFRLMAASLAWFVAGAAIGWSGDAWLSGGRVAPRPAEASVITGDALAAHRTFVVEIAHPVEVGASQTDHLVQWLSRRLGRPLRPPDLTALGWTLMGGRLLPAGQGAAAQFMYEDSRGTRVTLYLRADDSDATAFRFARSGEVSAFYWIDDGLGYVLSASVDRERLLAVAEAVYHQLDGNVPPGQQRG
jgi:anti-sigma factor RsiW